MDSTFSASEDFSKARFCKTLIIAFLSARDVSRAFTFNSMSDIFLCVCCISDICFNLSDLASAFVPASRPAVQSSIRMADDVDYEAQFKKLQSEAEDRLEEKVEDLMKNIETVGQK